MVVRFFLLALVVLTGVDHARADSPRRIPVGVSVTWNVGFGTNVYVTGNHPDLGSWTSTGAVKLRWTSGNVWTGAIGVQAGHALEYKFISRNGAAGEHCNPLNIVWTPGDNLAAGLPSDPAPPRPGKTVFYYSGWTNASLLVIDGTNYTGHPMTRVGPGRNATEFLYRADNVGVAGEGIEFVPNGYRAGGQQWDNPSDPAPEWGNNYYTTLDAFLLQDRQVYSYWPDPAPSAPRIETRHIGSSYPAITGRTAWIYLPRGYDSHPWKRYPVMYFHDGTNVFDPGGAFGSWSADRTATREIAHGRMRETILVAVNNADNRRVEYQPPGDTYPNEPPGHGHLYLNFLVHNVRPTLDVHYRTWNDPRNTVVGGSSMGGLISLYCGYETNIFGKVMAMSPSITRAPNYTAALWGKARRPERIYLDTGTAEGNVGIGVGNYWEKPWEAYDIFLAQGYVPNLDLLMRAGCGHVHNESAWAQRLPWAFRFLLPARDEPNRIEAATFPPELSSAGPDFDIAHDRLHRFRYHLQTAAGVSGTWTNLQTSAVETNPWSAGTWTNPPRIHADGAYRVSAEAMD